MLRKENNTKIKTVCFIHPPKNLIDSINPPISNTRHSNRPIAQPQAPNMHLHVGMGGYVMIGRDKMACTVIEIKRRNREIVIQYDHAYQQWSEDDMDAYGNINPWHQEYLFERNPKGQTETFLLRRKDNSWFRKGELSGPFAATLVLGERYHWDDPFASEKEVGRFFFVGSVGI